MGQSPILVNSRTGTVFFIADFCGFALKFFPSHETI
jgi:hypothetical protein